MPIALPKPTSSRQAHEAEYAWLWRDAAIGDVEFLDARFVTHSFAPHTHEGYAFGIVEAGAEAFFYRGATHVAASGQVIALNPDELHTGGAAAGAFGWKYRMLYPSRDFVLAVLGRNVDASETPTFPSPVFTDASLARVIRDLHADVQNQETSLRQATVTADVIRQLALRHSSDVRPRSSTRRSRRATQIVREYIDAHFDRNVTLQELGAAAGVSPYHLARMFRADAGIPPHRYLEQRRVRRARELIVAGWPLASAALEAGFNDQSQFSRHFKRHTGVTPGQYRMGVCGNHRADGVPGRTGSTLR